MMASKYGRMRSMKNSAGLQAMVVPPYFIVSAIVIGTELAEARAARSDFLGSFGTTIVKAMIQGATYPGPNGSRCAGSYSSPA